MQTYLKLANTDTTHEVRTTQGLVHHWLDLMKLYG